jgi:hypothetical protein
VAWNNVAMNDNNRGNSPRRRLQLLLQIPEKERTEEQWDEINELEIGLASGNRPDAGQQQRPGPPRGPGGPGNPNPSGPGGGGGQRGKKPFKKFRNRPPNRGTT